MSQPMINTQQFCRTLVRLPAPRMEHWEWQHRSTCQPHDMETFYPEGSRSNRDAITQDAKKLCQVCPVRQDCLEHALRTREPHGVWGGLTPTERARLINSQGVQSTATHLD